MNAQRNNCNKKNFVGYGSWMTRPVRMLLVALAAFAIAHARPCAAHQQIADLIVDTDMALDDARALVMLLTAPELSVKAIVTSDGSAPPLAGATNVLRILHFLGVDGIPVGAGRALQKPEPAWGELSRTLGWSELPLPPNPIVREAATVLTETFDRNTNRFIWVALGPLSNLGELLKARPNATKRISRVYYSGAHPDASDAGWNTRRDPEAARAVFNSGLEIVAVQLPSQQTLPFDTQLHGQIAQLDTPAARLIMRLHAHPNVQQLLAANHFRAWDETVVLAMLEPSIGNVQPSVAHSNTLVLDRFDIVRARAAYISELAHTKHELVDRPLVLLSRFPVNPEMFQPDVQPLVSEIIARHGLEEWMAVVLTSELHRHLGLYSILGAKMGLRARELLGAGLDELQVESLAGSKPPVSCLNDGLQVATGASLGRGTIKIASNTNTEPAAVFTFGQRKLHMRVKPEVLERIRGTLRALAAEHGESTPANFAALRRFALDAWVDFDRTKIFDEALESTTDAPKK